MLMERSTQQRFQPVEIGQIDGTRTVIEAVPKAMSAYAGAPMIGKIEKKVGLLAKLRQIIHDDRAQHLVDHQAEDMLLQRACQVGIGYPDGNDADFLRTDPAILEALDRHPIWGLPAASQETTSRFEAKALNEENVEKARDVFGDHYMAHNRKRPKKIELDFDGSMMKTYGAQEGAIYRGGKYKQQMYFPLFGFIGGWLVAATLRMGDQGEAPTVVPELKRIVGRLRERWRGIPITVRMDAAFGSPELYRWCREQRVGYEIGLRATSVLDLYAKWFMWQADQEFCKEFGEPEFVKADNTKDGEAVQAEHARVRRLPTEERMEAEDKRRRRRVRVVGEFSYKAESWDEWERIIVRVDFTDTGLDVRYVIVSQKRGIPKKIYEDQYCQRGLMEQFIGRFKQVGQRLSAQTFFTNQFRIIMYGASYQLLFHLQEYLSSKLKHCDVNTLRKTLMLMPSVIRCTAKKIVIEVSQWHPHCKEFLATWRRLAAV
jgi:Transposase DDE domain group 1